MPCAMQRHMHYLTHGQACPGLPVIVAEVRSLKGLADLAYLTAGAEAGLVDNCPAPPCEGRCQRRWAVRASFRGNELAIEEWRFTGSVQLPEKAR